MGGGGGVSTLIAHSTTAAGAGTFAFDASGFDVIFFVTEPGQTNNEFEIDKQAPDGSWVYCASAFYHYPAIATGPRNSTALNGVNMRAQWTIGGYDFWIYGDIAKVVGAPNVREIGSGSVLYIAGVPAADQAPTNAISTNGYDNIGIMMRPKTGVISTFADAPTQRGGTPYPGVQVNPPDITVVTYLYGSTGGPVTPAAPTDDGSNSYALVGQVQYTSTPGTHWGIALYVAQLATSGSTPGQVAMTFPALGGGVPLFNVGVEQFRNASSTITALFSSFTGDVGSPDHSTGATLNLPAGSLGRVLRDVEVTASSVPSGDAYVIAATGAYANHDPQYDTSSMPGATDTFTMDWAAHDLVNGNFYASTADWMGAIYAITPSGGHNYSSIDAELTVYTLGADGSWYEATRLNWFGGAFTNPDVVTAVGPTANPAAIIGSQIAFGWSQPHNVNFDYWVYGDSFNVT